MGKESRVFEEVKVCEDEVEVNQDEVLNEVLNGRKEIEIVLIKRGAVDYKYMA